MPDRPMPSAISWRRATTPCWPLARSATARGVDRLPLWKEISLSIRTPASVVDKSALAARGSLRDCGGEPEELARRREGHGVGGLQAARGLVEQAGRDRSGERRDALAVGVGQALPARVVVGQQGLH